MIRKKTKSAARPARPSAADALGASAPLSEHAALLALAAPAAPAPSPRVKAQLLARIRASRVAAARVAAVPVGWRFDSARAAAGWRETFPGVRHKTLSVDEARDVVMLLVEMAPGARFPDHSHDQSSDEGLVISGDLVMDGRELRAGDYYHAEIGTRHMNITSPSGCTALLNLRAAAWRKWSSHASAR